MASLGEVNALKRPHKILVMRFSAIGDVVQFLSVVGALKQRFPDAKIHWLTREDLKPLIEHHPAVARVWQVSRKDGLKGLWKLALGLRDENYTHIYDGHNNIRSRLISWLVLGPFLVAKFKPGLHFIRRGKYRWRRILLFWFRINRYPKPFTGQFSLLEPLGKWGVPSLPPSQPQLFLSPDTLGRAEAMLGPLRVGFKGIIGLAPSASYELKRWPVEYWQSLVKLAPEYSFVVLGGPQDSFCEEIASQAPERVMNLAGKISLIDSCGIVAKVDLLIAGDTGLLHVAEQVGKPAIALMGPAPFGFPCRETTRILERELKCRPCSKHGEKPCKNVEFQKCLRDILPSEVVGHLRAMV
jgi:lipopolysaccharide heptosyltransferase II